MKLYTLYVNNYEKAALTLQHIKKRDTSGLKENKENWSRFVEFLEKVYATCPQCKQGGDLESFLINPIQRIPRYGLLLGVSLYAYV